jgi:hypothetical protein
MPFETCLVPRSVDSVTNPDERLVAPAASDDGRLTGSADQARFLWRLSAADTVEATVSHRPYREVRRLEEAVEEITSRKRGSTTRLSWRPVFT